MPEDPEGAYFTEIETEFIRRRGTPFLLSPKDYALARRWFALGIPVADVCAGIGDAFEGRAERGASGRVNSLGYCEGAVLDAWERRASARVGRPSEAAAGETAAGLAALRETLGGVDARFSEPAAAAQKALERLSASGKAPEEVERSLARIDKRLLRGVEEALSAQERERIRAEVDRRLGGDAADMDERALRRTRDVLARHRLRALFRLPRLSLLS